MLASPNEKSTKKTRKKKQQKPCGISLSPNDSLTKANIQNFRGKNHYT